MMTVQYSRDSERATVPDDDGAVVRGARPLTAAARARLPRETREALARLHAGEIQPLSMRGRA